MFISIYRDHELKGSMGYTLPIFALLKSVIDRARGIIFLDKPVTFSERITINSALMGMFAPITYKQAFIAHPVPVESPQGFVRMSLLSFTKQERAERMLSDRNVSGLKCRAECGE